MKYHLHENGWVVFVDDIDLKFATHEDILQLSNLCATYTCVKIINQNLTLADEVEFIKKWKDPHKLYEADHPLAERFNLDSEGYVQRVTGKKNVTGFYGVAGHDCDGLWHNESPQSRGKSSIAYLYAVEGTPGSITEWNNTVLAYKDLDENTKEQIKDLKGIFFGHLNHSVERTLEDFDRRKIYEDSPVPLVYTNHVGQTGLYLSIDQFERFVGMTREESLKIARPLFEFITQKKYCYLHEWTDGEVSISDQWLGVHRRLAFSKMVDRMVHRGTFDYVTT